MPDIKVRIGQSDAIKVTSTGLQRSDIAFSVSGGTANVTQLDVSGQRRSQLRPSHPAPSDNGLTRINGLKSFEKVETWNRMNLIH